MLDVIAVNHTVAAADSENGVRTVVGLDWVAGRLVWLSVVFLASRMGAATLISTVVTGQLIFALAVDHFGWIGFQIHRDGALSILGCALMVGGFARIAKF